ncbi:hypothetical protein QOT17_021337 [Balamuthia mandrillaris]
MSQSDTRCGSVLPRRLDVRPVSPSNLDQLHALILEFARSTNYQPPSGATLCTRQGLAKHLLGPKPKALAFLFYYHGEPVGYATAYFSFRTFRGQALLIGEDVYVRPQFQQQKFGLEILAFLAKLSRDEGCETSRGGTENDNEAMKQCFRCVGCHEVSAGPSDPAKRQVYFGLEGKDRDRFIERFYPSSTASSTSSSPLEASSQPAAPKQVARL